MAGRQQPTGEPFTTAILTVKEGLLDFDTAIPGHGPVLTKADVRVFRDKMQ